MNGLVDQISVFVENKPGKLAAIAEVMEAQMVNILAFSIAETDGFGLVRAVVENPQTVQKVMKDLGYAVMTTKVLAVKMRDQPGGLKEIAVRLGEKEVNIEYAYAFQNKGAAVLVIRVDNAEKAAEVLQNAGFTLLDENGLREE